jgi:hypothetical protein
VDADADADAEAEAELESEDGAEILGAVAATTKLMRKGVMPRLRLMPTPSC